MFSFNKGIKCSSFQVIIFFWLAFILFQTHSELFCKKHVYIRSLTSIFYDVSLQKFGRIFWQCSDYCIYYFVLILIVCKYKWDIGISVPFVGNILRIGVGIFTFSILALMSICRYFCLFMRILSCCNYSLSTLVIFNSSTDTSCPDEWNFVFCLRGRITWYKIQYLYEINPLLFCYLLRWLKYPWKGVNVRFNGQIYWCL